MISSNCSFSSMRERAEPFSVWEELTTAFPPPISTVPSGWPTAEVDGGSATEQQQQQEPQSVPLIMEAEARCLVTLMAGLCSSPQHSADWGGDQVDSNNLDVGLFLLLGRVVHADHMYRCFQQCGLCSPCSRGTRGEATMVPSSASVPLSSQHEEENEIEVRYQTTATGSPLLVPVSSHRVIPSTKSFSRLPFCRMKPAFSAEFWDRAVAPQLTRIRCPWIRVAACPWVDEHDHRPAFDELEAQPCAGTGLLTFAGVFGNVPLLMRVLNKRNGAVQQQCIANAVEGLCEMGHYDALIYVFLHGPKSVAQNPLVLIDAARRGDNRCIRILQRFHCVEDFSLPGPSGNTALHLAAVYNRRSTVRLLLLEGARVDVRNGHGSTPLHYAVSKNRVGIAQLLLNRRRLMCAKARGITSDVDEDDEEEQELHHRSSTTGTSAHQQSGGASHCDCLAVADFDPTLSIVDNKGRTPLFVAAEEGHEECIRLLVSRVHGSLLRQQLLKVAHDGNALLCIAAQKGRTEVVKALIAHEKACFGKPQLEYTQRSDGATPMYLAALEGHDEVLQVLLQEGCNVNVRTDNQLWTPLHAAAKMGNLSAVQSLFAGNADVNARTRSDETPLFVACEFQHLSVVSRLLDDGGADMRIANCEGLTPLHIASKQGHAVLVRQLLASLSEESLQNSVNYTTKSGETPLFLAAQNGHTGVIEHLLLQGAKVDQKNAFGYTPAFAAAYCGETAAVRVLAQHGANLRAKDNYGTSMKEAARTQRHDETLRALTELKHGSDADVGSATFCCAQ